MFKRGVVVALAAGMAMSGLWACSDDRTEQQEEEGILLPGDDDKPAVEATYNFAVPPDVDVQYVSTKPGEYEDKSYLRTELTIVFDQEATVGEVNRVLGDIDGRVVDMISNHLDLTVEVPDPGNMEAVEQLIEDVESRDVVKVALDSPLVQPIGEDVGESGRPLLPEGFYDEDGEVQHLAHIDHQLAVRAHAAWNAHEAIVSSEERPWLVVTDFFGHGAPGEVFDVSVEDSGDFADEEDRNWGDINRHGYHVLGIISGAFSKVDGEDDVERDNVTGVFPEELRLRGVDMEKWWTRNRLISRTGGAVEDILDEDPDARVVLNSSIGNSEAGSNPRRARSWTRAVRDDADEVGNGKEEHLLHFTAAGNAKQQDDGSIQRWDAVDSGPFPYAALGHMETVIGTVYPNLTNIHVVENRRNINGDDVNQEPLAACANTGSILEGTLSAIGSDVHSIGECTETENGSCVASSGQDSAEEASGTSMATPQAAGLGAFMWSVNPELSVQEVHEMILDTAYWSSELEGRGSNCHPDGEAEPVIDALAAVLAAGGDEVRTAILDVTDSGSFGEEDVALFVDKFDTADGSFDFSRYDITGDGQTGSTTERSVRFDLDDSHNHDVAEQSISQPAGPETRTVEYDEKQVSDWDAVCYYAYSDLFEGDESERDELLSARCTGALIEVSVIDGQGDPLEGAPMEVTRQGEFTFHEIEDLGDGEYQIWVRESDEDYDIEVPSGYAVAGKTTIEDVERYEVRDGDDVQIHSAPEPTLELNTPQEGRTYYEGADVDVHLYVETPSNWAAVEVEVEGQTMDTFELEEHGAHEPVLQIDGICPRGFSEIAVHYEDGFGNQLTESVEVEVVEAPLTLAMHGAGPVEISWESSPVSGDDPYWYVPTQSLEGEAIKPKCDYPDDEHLDEEELTWWTPDPWEGSEVEWGPTKEVDDAFFRDNGDHVRRTVGLSFEYQDEEEAIKRSLTPCYGELYITHDLRDGDIRFEPVVELGNMVYPEGPVPEEDYPPCVTHESVRTGILEDYYANLAEFEQIQTALEAQAVLDDIYDDLLTELDPNPPFPKDLWHVVDKYSGHWDMELAQYLFSDLAEALYDNSLAEMERDVGAMLMEAQEELSSEDFTYLALVAEEVAFHAMMFSPVEEGGNNAWRHFGFVDDADQMASEGQVDPMAPARAALGSYTEAIHLTTEHGDYTEAEVGPSVDAGMYGAMSEAIDAAESAHDDP